jgi:tRNA U34 2-thiouridine synthase MnmA/TrmU
VTDKPKAIAIALLSGGLDSTLAVKLVLDQGVQVIGVKFTSPFCNCDQGGRCFSREVADQLGIPLRTVSKGEEYLEVVRQPRHGYGSGMNPCIDCRIFMFKKTWAMAAEIGAQFIITGEVLGQRPMSQHMAAIRLIERQSGMERRVLRPLSAIHFPPTIAEEQGWVDRSRLLGLSGRSRKPQLQMARELGIDAFACAAGGCLLTEKLFAVRLRDLFKTRPNVSMRDMMVLKVGRRFAVGDARIVVGRDETENHVLETLRRPDDYLFEVRECGSPVTLLEGPPSGPAIEAAARLTARYSDCRDAVVAVHYGQAELDRVTEVSPISDAEAAALRVG